MSDNIITIEGHKAFIKFDPDIQMFRGEFCSLAHGGADFYADSVEGLYKEGAISLKVYLDMCREKGLETEKQYSGRLNLRLDSATHGAVERAARAAHESANSWIKNLIQKALAAANDDFSSAPSARAK